MEEAGAQAETKRFVPAAVAECEYCAGLDRPASADVAELVGRKVGRIFLHRFSGMYHGLGLPDGDTIGGYCFYLGAVVLLRQ